MQYKRAGSSIVSSAGSTIHLADAAITQHIVDWLNEQPSHEVQRLALQTVRPAPAPSGFPYHLPSMPEDMRMTPAAQGTTYAAFRNVGWSDAQLRAHGYLERIPKDRWAQLKSLTGNWRDGSDTNVHLSQDDATQACVITVGLSTVYSAATFDEALDLALAGERK